MNTTNGEEFKGHMSSDAQQGKPSHLPGEPGVWVLIGGDMLVFSLFFLTYLAYRNASLSAYLAAQDMLNVSLGLCNTILLLTSSWCVAQSIRVVRDDQRRRASALLLFAFLCGLGFCGLKIVEYHEKFSVGLNIGTNEFFMFYFMLTGIHLLHVVVGLGVLLGIRFKLSRSSQISERDMALIESGATFWHLVDVLWIVLFALLYLVR
jgi:nitric oxide reductase NorE protein